MSICVPRRRLQSSVAIVGIVLAASSLAGCSTFGMGDDQTVTGSTGYRGTSNLNQPMPSALGQGSQVADNGPYTPPEDIGSGSGSYSSPSLPMSGQGYPSYASLPPASAPRSGSFSSQDLPVIGNTSSTRSLPDMSAQPAQHPMASISSAPKPLAAAPSLSVVPTGTYTHVIRSGESLYTIARHYGVTAQSIMAASKISAPDKIVVGQRVVIPGRPDLLAAMDDAKLPAGSDKLPVDSSKPVVASTAPDPLHLHEPEAIHRTETHVASLGNNEQQPVVPLAGRILATPAAAPMPTHNAIGNKPAAMPLPKAPMTAKLPAAKPTAPTTPTMVASAPQAAPRVPMQEPAVSGASKFRWPVSGKVIVDFAASRGTGINIAAPSGTPVKAVENGTVIYVGSGVEGYGNLILIRHANGYVSAYADLKDMNVQKNTVVARGDTIGSAGATGSVTSPQLHFELRKGATPVDPVPLLAG